MLGWEVEETTPKIRQTQLFVPLSIAEQHIYDYLKTLDKEQLDVIAINCKLPTFKVLPLLLQLEIKGLVEPLPGKLYRVV